MPHKFSINLSKNFTSYQKTYDHRNYGNVRKIPKQYGDNRDVARNFLEGGSKSSKMLATGWTAKKIFGYVTAKTVNFGPFSMRFHAL